MRSILRWLRGPVGVKPIDIDWRDFGRSFGRFVGGSLDSGEEDTPAGRAWDRGGRDRGDGRPTPRWVVIVAVLIGLTFWGIVLTVVLTR